MSIKETRLIGNDIICYGSINSSVRFLNKIINPSEKIAISDIQQNPNLTAILFSIKESAYKIVMKHDCSVSFSPARFEIKTIVKQKVQNGNEYFTGLVAYDDFLLFFQTTSCQEFTHTVSAECPEAIENADILVNYCPGLTNQKQSLFAHKQMKKMLQEKFKTKTSFLVNKKSNGVPYAECPEVNTFFDISISHDLNYIATVILCYNVNADHE